MLATFLDLFVSGAALISGTLVLGLLLGVLSTLFARTTPRQALRTLAAFDIGSGATKVLVAEVDSLGVIVGSPLYEAEKPMAYKADAQAHGGSLSEGIQGRGLELVQALVAKARELGATEASGIATEVFRTAPNGRAFLDQISAKTGSPSPFSHKSMRRAWVWQRPRRSSAQRCHMTLSGIREAARSRSAPARRVSLQELRRSPPCRSAALLASSARLHPWSVFWCKCSRGPLI
jgi:hypothetical protein